MNENIVDAILFFLFSCGALYAVTRIVLQIINNRRHASAPELGPLEERLARIEQIVESTAVEVERVAEGNRFMAKLLSDRGTNLSLPRQGARVITPH